MSFQENAIFWVEVDRIKPNPYQPRREFDEARLKDLSDSIRQYGVLQPLVVTRHELQRDDGSFTTEYELIAGERRLRASKMAGLLEIPVMIRVGEASDRAKLEIAIIENLQREDLNPVDRALAFERLSRDFGFSHGKIGQTVGKSRVYVTNTIRILGLPDDMKDAIVEGHINEGHTRPLLMLTDRPEEQATLFKEIVHRQITVRDAEEIARRIAKEKARKKEFLAKPEMLALEERLAESLGTRVHIQQREVGGKILIDFFTNEDLEKLVNILNAAKGRGSSLEAGVLAQYIHAPEAGVATSVASLSDAEAVPVDAIVASTAGALQPAGEAAEAPVLDLMADEEIAEEENDLYSVRNFTI